MRAAVLVGNRENKIFSGERISFVVMEDRRFPPVGETLTRHGVALRIYVENRDYLRLRAFAERLLSLTKAAIEDGDNAWRGRRRSIDEWQFILDIEVR